MANTHGHSSICKYILIEKIESIACSVSANSVIAFKQAQQLKIKHNFYTIFQQTTLWQNWQRSLKIKSYNETMVLAN